VARIMEEYFPILVDPGLNIGENSSPSVPPVPANILFIDR
jgi:hypothetical protein